LTRLVLASASPRRRELLGRAGVAHEVIAADVDETPRPGEPPLAYAARVAADKAAAIRARHPDSAVLAADTVVTMDDEIFGKAEDETAARAMLGRLAGRTHTVATAVHLSRPGGEQHALTVTAEVDLRPLLPATIADYVASGEWRGKAGAYAVQGIGAALVRSIRGSYTAVVGLPLVEVLELLAVTGVAWARLSDGTPS
jgi:septum formation protein